MADARFRFVAAAALAMLVTAAHAQRSVFLEELTSPELAAQLRAGKTTILIPIGGTEQNGPHMVLGKHNVRVRALAERIALALGNALVAPVLAYVPEGDVDPPSAHMRFAGTITIPPATFESVLESTARSLRVHGFRDIVFIGDHGGYQRYETAVAQRLDREWAKTSARAARSPTTTAPRTRIFRLRWRRTVTPRRRSVRTPAWPILRSRSPSIQSWCAPTHSRREATSMRRTASTAIRDARRPSLADSASTRSSSVRSTQSGARPRVADAVFSHSPMSEGHP
jgi:Uncharacterized protein, putative amidase